MKNDLGPKDDFFMFILERKSLNRYEYVLLVFSIEIEV